LKTDKELTQAFYKANLDPTVTTTVYSGSGLSAFIIELAFRVLGNNKTSVYLGSWQQYVKFALDCNILI
jgi:3-mercaptopyruvate sulfurtransferase SseA